MLWWVSIFSIVMQKNNIFKCKYHRFHLKGYFFLHLFSDETVIFLSLFTWATTNQIATLICREKESIVILSPWYPESWFVNWAIFKWKIEASRESHTQPLVQLRSQVFMFCQSFNSGLSSCPLALSCMHSKLVNNEKHVLHLMPSFSHNNRKCFKLFGLMFCF